MFPCMVSVEFSYTITLHNLLFDFNFAVHTKFIASWNTDYHHKYIVFHVDFTSHRLGANINRIFNCMRLTTLSPYSSCAYHVLNSIIDWFYYYHDTVCTVKSMKHILWSKHTSTFNNKMEFLTHTFFTVGHNVNILHIRTNSWS